MTIIQQEQRTGVDQGCITSTLPLFRTTAVTFRKFTSFSIPARHILESSKAFLKAGGASLSSPFKGNRRHPYVLTSKELLWTISTYKPGRVRVESSIYCTSQLPGICRRPCSRERWEYAHYSQQVLLRLVGFTHTAPTGTPGTVWAGSFQPPGALLTGSSKIPIYWCWRLAD